VAEAAVLRKPNRDMIDPGAAPAVLLVAVDAASVERRKGSAHVAGVTACTGDLEMHPLEGEVGVRVEVQARYIVERGGTVTASAIAGKVPLMDVHVAGGATRPLLTELAEAEALVARPATHLLVTPGEDHSGGLRMLELDLARAGNEALGRVTGVAQDSLRKLAVGFLGRAARGQHQPPDRDEE
jgi:hypothetical protein